MGSRVLSHRVSLCVLTLIVALLATGCPEQPPEIRIAETRNQYFIEPTGMLVQEIEVSAENFEEGTVAGEAADEGEVAAVAEEVAEDEANEEGVMEIEGPRSVNVLFDLIVRYDGSRESLPGITVEVAHSDPFEKEKARYLQWIETDGMSRGDARQMNFEREIPNYETGDAFAIEFREAIPREEFGDYKEFEGIAP